MYVLYPIFKDMASDIRGAGDAFLDSIKQLLMACHKTKGFSVEVLYDSLLNLPIFLIVCPGKQISITEYLVFFNTTSPFQKNAWFRQKSTWKTQCDFFSSSLVKSGHMGKTTGSFTFLTIVRLSSVIWTEYLLGTWKHSTAYTVL